MDGYGDLLVGPPGILRITDDGDQSVFASTPYSVYGLAVAPDGDVWALGRDDIYPAALYRFDPAGRLKEAVVQPVLANDIAFSPVGVLHFLDQSGMYIMASGNPVRVVATAPRGLRDIAFDADGYFYVTNDLGDVLLYSPTYQPVEIPFATMNLSPPLDILFLRDTESRMTARLLLVHSGYDLDAAFRGTLMELNPAGVRATGSPEQPRLLRVASDSLAPGRVGSNYGDTLRAIDGARPLSWRVSAGRLPPGIALDPASGALSGVPAAKGTFTFTVRVTDDRQAFGTGLFAIEVGEPALAVDKVVDAILGVSGLLTADEERYLDLQGNRNGRWDVGDAHAFLRARGQGAAAAASVMAGHHTEKQ